MHIFSVKMFSLASKAQKRTRKQRKKLNPKEVCVQYFFNVLQRKYKRAFSTSFFVADKTYNPNGKFIAPFSPYIYINTLQYTVITNIGHNKKKT